MATPKKKYPYAIIREDNSYNVYDLTKDDYETIKMGLFTKKSYVEISMGLISLKDIRSVIEQKDEPKPKKEEKEANPPMSVEEVRWYNQLKEMGIFDEEEGDF